jgi:hypothetical protein
MTNAVKAPSSTPSFEGLSSFFSLVAHLFTRLSCKAISAWPGVFIQLGYQLFNVPLRNSRTPYLDCHTEFMIVVID